MVRAKIDVECGKRKLGKIRVKGSSEAVIREIGWIVRAFWQSVPQEMVVGIRAQLLEEIQRQMRKDR